MNTDLHERKKPGDPMKFRAESFNYMMEGAELAHRQTRFAVDMESPDRACEVVKVWNQTKKHLEKYAVVGLGDAALIPEHRYPDNSDPVDPFDLFLGDQVYLQGVVPTLKHVSAFGILLEPLNHADSPDSPDLGLAVVAGCVQVKVRKSGSGDRWASVIPGETRFLAGKPSRGEARIVWLEPGAGVKWAVVLLGLAGRAKQTAHICRWGP